MNHASPVGSSLAVSPPPAVCRRVTHREPETVIPLDGLLVRMLEWVSTKTLLDVSINAVPLAMLAYFALLFGLGSRWGPNPVAVAFTHTLTLFPLVVLLFATYYVARAISRDAAD